jgi:hypothetical protein
MIVEQPQEIRDRYKATITKVDKFGRAIKVGRLTMSQETRAAELAESFASIEMMRTICSLRQIDDDMIPFPRDRAQLDAIMDRLDREGVTAIREAMAEMVGPAVAPAEKAAAAKN